MLFWKHIKNDPPPGRIFSLIFIKYVYTFFILGAKRPLLIPFLLYVSLYVHFSIVKAAILVSAFRSLDHFLLLFEMKKAGHKKISLLNVQLNKNGLSLVGVGPLLSLSHYRFQFIEPDIGDKQKEDIFFK